MLAAVAGWFAVIFFASRAGEGLFLSNLPNIYLYTATFALWFLFTQGAMRRRPVRLPVDVMRKTATQRFSQEKTWESAKTRQEALDTLLTQFNGKGVSARSVNDTVWVEMGKEWTAADWRRKEAVEHIKIPPSAHFFVEEAEPGSRITAFSHDKRLAGMWDVMKLSDEMADTAVRLAREATTR
ncbi:hypothetical protein [Arthrobacter monumenti]